MDRLMDPYHVGKSCSKFSYILPSGLGEDSMMDQQALSLKSVGIIRILLYHENIIQR